MVRKIKPLKRLNSLWNFIWIKLLFLWNIGLLSIWFLKDLLPIKKVSVYKIDEPLMDLLRWIQTVCTLYTWLLELTWRVPWSVDVWICWKKNKLKCKICSSPCQTNAAMACFCFAKVFMEAKHSIGIIANMNFHKESLVKTNWIQRILKWKEKRASHCNGVVIGIVTYLLL